MDLGAEGELDQVGVWSALTSCGDWNNHFTSLGLSFPTCPSHTSHHCCTSKMNPGKCSYEGIFSCFFLKKMYICPQTYP